MIQQNKQLQSKALMFLARREHAPSELFNKLRRYSSDIDAIHQVLQHCIIHGYLSEERYIKNYIDYKSKRYGLAKIRYSLHQKIDNHDLIEQIISECCINQIDVACKLLGKKFGTGKPATLVMRSKYSLFLHQKGFDYSIIHQVLK